MKSLIKIYSKYIGMAWVISMLFLAINAMIFFGLMMKAFYQNSDAGYVRARLQQLADSIEADGAGSLQISENGIAKLKADGMAFMLVLDDDGNVIDSWNQPESFKQHYTAGDIAAFSKWYLEDYPVAVWKLERGLMVLGYPKDSLAKYNVELSVNLLNNFFWYFKALAAGNIFFILSMVFFLGYRYYKSMKPLAEGLTRLSANKRVCLSEKGVTSDLAAKINQTSAILEKQQRSLKERDHARTEWIAGVSHDIRTPLSVIMGYADDLENNEAIPLRERKKAGIMKAQGLRLKQLIEDLNLTSKLAYQMQPLKMEIFSPAPLLRSMVVERLNEGLDEGFLMIPEIQPSVEGRAIEADKGLLIRAVGNLLNNSIEHNPGGCTIHLEAAAEDRWLKLAVTDDGCGIPEEICEILLEEGSGGKKTDKDNQEENEKKPHIMGLRIVKQIALAHKGGFEISNQGCRVEIRLPLLPS